MRQEATHVPSPKDFDFEERGTIISDSDIGCYVRPEFGNHILIGNKDPECDPHHWVDNDAEYDGSLTDH